MKQIKDLAWMSAIALAGTITFAACSSDDDKVQNINPTYDGKSVKTQFAINIPRAAQQTRQTEAIVQEGASPTFRGMQDIKLVPMKEQTISANTTETFWDVVSLENITETITAEASKKIYSDVDVPVGTKSFLFYGKAAEEDNSTSATNGVLTATGIEKSNQVSSINFTLSQVLPNNTTLTNPQNTLIGYLNSIVSTSGWSATDNQDLLNAYKSLTSLKVCSSTHILKMMQNVYTTVSAVNHSNYTTLVDNIKSAIAGQDKGFTESNGTLSYTSEDEKVTNFPEEFGIPAGAVALSFDAQAKNFSAANATSIGTSNSISIASICYPSALYYFANTNLRTNDNEIADNDWLTGTTNWADDNKWTGWGNEVTASTQSIALKDNINYGVALLKTTVKASDATLKDNDEADFTIDNDDLQLTGVLVGGQPTILGWDMLPTATPTATAEYTQTVFDSQMNENIYVGTADPTTSNYTLLLDNTMTNPSSNTEKKVSVAIELKNNSDNSFAGVDGIVPAGGKFYLIGQLNPLSGGNATNSQTVTLDRVFAQDYTTTANFTISNLKNAYITIPDLRSTQLKLGLSVDLEWKAGLTFDVTIN